MTTEPAAFALSALLLFFVPGPTNTLLAISAISDGPGKALRLLAAEAVGYSISISVLTFLVGPTFGRQPQVAMGLKVMAAAYVLYSALRLWRRAAEPAKAHIRFSQVLMTTVLNAKGLVIAFALMPSSAQASVSGALLYLALTLCLAATAGVMWISAGGLVGRTIGNQRGRTRLNRLGALALAGFSVALVGNALA